MSPEAKVAMSDRYEDQVKGRLVDLAADRPQIYEAAQDWFIQQGEEVIPVLVQGLEEEYLGAVCHGRILRLLEHFAREETIPAIIRALHTALQRRNHIVIPAAMEALAAFHTPEAVQTLIDLTRERNPDIVKQAAALLGRTGEAQALESLVALLGSNNPFIRYSAARALTKLDFPAARQALAQHLETETDEEIQELLYSAGIRKTP
jgi:HEAT repeat protein